MGAIRGYGVAEMKFSNKELEVLGLAQAQMGSFALRPPARIVWCQELSKKVRRFIPKVLLGES